MISISCSKIKAVYILGGLILKVVVIGAGPAGMMAAMTAGKEHNVTLIDGNEKVGKKLFITGKGRCNVTNSRDISDFFDYIYGNPHFLYSSLYTFTNEDTIKFFEEQNIKLKSERGGRVFPKSDKSSDIIKGLTNGLKKVFEQANVYCKANRCLEKVITIFYFEEKVCLFCRREKYELFKFYCCFFR